MTIEPVRGDVVQLRTQPVRFRRRVGAYRILFRLDVDSQVVNVTDIDRRTTTTYRRR
jgi:mRNA-degrading endonuclease RelE of RelBE toxin-antitoxin system